MIRVHNLSYRYPGHTKPVLYNCSLTLPRNGLHLLAGPSASGKTTLLRLLNGLAPHFFGGELRGEVSVFGADPTILGPRAMATHVGYLFQQPENQFVCEIVLDELYSFLEHFSIDRSEMNNRWSHVADKLGIAHLKHRSIDSLSSGERQKVAIATLLTIRPSVLVLDEPLSQLDYRSKSELISLLNMLKSDLLILMAEHDEETVLPICDSVISFWNSPQSPKSVSVESYRVPRTNTSLSGNQHNQQNSSMLSPPVFVAKDLSYTTASGRCLFHKLSLTGHPGQTIAVTGHNGSGKSTLLRILGGYLPPHSGVVKMTDSIRVGALPQNPRALFFLDTLYDELAFTAACFREKISINQAEQFLESFNLKNQLHCHPRDLSMGQQQRAALAMILIAKRDLLILDEPTRGMDFNSKTHLIEILRRAKMQGVCTLLATHDEDLIQTTIDHMVDLNSISHKSSYAA